MKSTFCYENGPCGDLVDERDISGNKHDNTLATYYTTGKKH